MSKDAQQQGQSGWAVIASIGGTAAITLVKLLAFLFGGSAAMLAEAIHSLIDTGDGLLLYLGRRRSAKPPDADHPFGYGKELYFWTLIVALVMFTVGGVVTVTQGVYRVIEPGELEGLAWTYAVLGAAAVFNGFTWVVALKEFLAGKGDKSFRRALRQAKDPTVLTVLFEDSASLVGLLFAFLGIFLGQLLHLPALDGVASILIGLLMGAVAVGLVYQCKTLLVGEPANEELLAAVRSLAEGDAAVEQVGDLLTMHLGPQDVLLNARVRFRPGLSAPQMGQAVERLERTIRDRHPEIRRTFIEAGPLDRGRIAA